MAFARHTCCALLAVVVAGVTAATTGAPPVKKPAGPQIMSKAAQARAQPPQITPKATEPRPSKEGVDYFEKKIRPVLVHHCYKCHSGDPAKAKAHLVLDTHDGLRKGGESGEVVAPRHPEKSLLIEAINYEGLEMPPDGQLPDEVIADFEKWVEK